MEKRLREAQDLIKHYKKEENYLKRGFVLCILFLMLSALFCGCVEKQKDNVEMKNREDVILCGVEYVKRNGMVYGDDMDVSINSDRIVYARLFSVEEYEKEPLDGEYNDGYVEVEDIPIEEDQWAAIEKAVMAIIDLFEEIPNEKFENPFGKVGEMFATDGPNYSYFYMTWRDQNGEETKIQYYIPNDRRFNTILSLMEETVNTTGGEIIYCEQRDN